jgi:hypothetical protein
MKKTKGFWHNLLFLWLIVVFSSGLAQPAGSIPARAAPIYQGAPVCDLVMAQWTFDNPTPSSTSAPAPTTANVTATAAQSGVNQLVYQPTGARSGNAWSGTGWSQTATPNSYYEFNVSTVGYTGIKLSLWHSRSSTGPQNISVQYSVDGASFSEIGSYTVATSVSQTTVDFSALPLLDNNPNARFRIYGINATGSGSLRIDDVTVTGCQPATPTSTPTETGTPTNTATPTDTGTPTNTGTPTETGTPTNTSTATATATNTLVSSTVSVVISEFRTRGPRGANDEFIELYNPTTSAIDISNWRINASNASGGTGTRATIPPSTILRSGQYYLVANAAVTDGYNNTNVPPNLVYGTGISDDGGIALFKADNTTIVDQVGMSTGSAYKEGTVLSDLSENVDRSYERKPGGASDSCQDTNNNANDFAGRTPSNPQNYSSQLSLCGTLRPIPVTTTTTITADAPDPSLINGNVSVSVIVTGGSPLPAGIVNITGANTTCTITLSAAGTGSCTVTFTSTGTKTLIATYIGDNLHLGSIDTETHQVLTSSQATAARTPTRVPTLLPPPPLLVINEFVPHPGHDWNLDGVINVDDEYIEILNHGVIDVNLSGYTLDDEVNIGSAPFRLPADVTLKPGERRVFYGSETGLRLSDGGDGVRLLQPNGQLMDAYNYFVVRSPDQSYCRLPDNGGADDWNENCFPTPGLQNSLNSNTVNPPIAGGVDRLCPIADTLPEDFVYAECLPFGNNIWNPAYWNRFGWYNETYLPESSGKWPVFVD